MAASAALLDKIAEEVACYALNRLGGRARDIRLALLRVRVKPVSMYLLDGSRLRVVDGCMAISSFLPSARLSVKIPRVDLIVASLDVVALGYSRGSGEAAERALRIVRAAVRNASSVRLDGLLSRSLASELALALPYLEELGLVTDLSDPAIEAADRKVNHVIDECNEALRTLISTTNAFEDSRVRRELEAVARRISSVLSAMWSSFVAPISIRHRVDVEIPIAVAESRRLGRRRVCASVAASGRELLPKLSKEICRSSQLHRIARIRVSSSTCLNV